MSFVGVGQGHQVCAEDVEDMARHGPPVPAGLVLEGWGFEQTRLFLHEAPMGQVRFLTGGPFGHRTTLLDLHDLGHRD